MHFGAEYYVEEWPRQRWDYDARLMAEAGFTVVRLAELAWALIETEPDRYDFAWLDEAIAVLHGHGISTLLSTPTTAPPAWLIDLDQRATLVRADGYRVPYGTWGNACLNGPVFRDRSRRIVEAMAEHYRDNEAVIGWQADNEFGVFDRARCYCDYCRDAFHVWLQRRYGTLAALHQAWGATFWSHVYSDWEQIPLPQETTTSRNNPGMVLDFARFSSDTTADYLRLQVDILRRHRPDRPITHNFVSAGYTHLDYFHLGETLDFVAWDNYIPHTSARVAALSHDVYRSVKRRPFWVLEQQCGNLFWQPYAALPSGVLRLMSYQGIAHGADGMVYFRWRSGLIGAEQLHAGILPHDGRPGRTYAEVKGLGQELKRLAPLLAGTLPRAQVAMVLDYDSLWALEEQPHHAALKDPLRHLTDHYEHLLARHIPVDFVRSTDDLSAYRLVVAASLFVVSPEAAANLAAYVAGGGVLLVTARSGMKDTTNRVVDQPLPALLAPVVGASVREYTSQPAGSECSVLLTDAAEATPLSTALWAENVEPDGAEVVARYADGLFRGAAAVTWRAVGGGGAMYQGALGADLSGRLLDRLVAQAGVEPPVAVEAPDCVEVATRQGDGRTILFLLNYDAEPQAVRLGATMRDLLDGSTVGACLELPPYGVRVLASKG
ncbi:MAG: beta-galactosidase [Anaerolineae bacterium]